MKIIVTKNYDDMSRKAANIISAQIISKPNCVLGLATGSTPIGTYDNLIDRYQKGDLDFSQVSTVNLDEYRGLDHENDQSYYYFMMNHLFKHVNIDVEKTHVPRRPTGFRQSLQRLRSDRRKLQRRRSAASWSWAQRSHRI